MPLPTRIVIALSNNLIRFMPFIVIGMFGAAWGFRTYYSTEKGKRVIDAITLKMPILGPIMRKIAVARFCRTLSTLMASGVPILDGLDITAKTSGNSIIEDAIQTTRKSIERGETIAAPLKETGVFPGMVVQMISVGEATGALDTMLGKIADFYEEEVDVAVEGLLTLLEPIMIAFLGGAVGGIVIAMYMPIFDLISKLTMKERTLRRRLAVHIAVRLLVATVLLGAAVIVELRAPGALPISPFFFLVGLTYAVSLGFIASLRFVDRLPWLTDVHFAIDAIIVSAAVFITGGVESLFAILYMLPIVAASTVQFRRGGLQIAGLSTFCICQWSSRSTSTPQGYLALPIETRSRRICRPPTWRSTPWRSTPSVFWPSRCSADRSPSVRGAAKRNSSRPPKRLPTSRRSISTSSTTC